MTIGIWELVAGGWCLVFAGCAAGWLLGVSSARSRRGGMLDLTPAPADGSLGLDWADPRARRWNETTKAEQDAWVQHGTIAPWRDPPLGQFVIGDDLAFPVNT